MRRVRIGIIGAGAVTEWAILPALSGPDIVAPPDTGAWWGRRPGSSSDIRYQAPARPEVVALADDDLSRAQRVGGAARVRAVYADWRLMLREVELDALLCLASPAVAAEVAGGAGAAVRWLWMDGPPAPTSAEAVLLARRLEGRNLRLWCARPLRQAAAHRAAWRLIERDALGAVSALALRWGTPFHTTADASPGGTRGSGHGAGGNGNVLAGDAPYLAPTYAALDMLLSFAGAVPLSSNAAASGSTGKAASEFINGTAGYVSAATVMAAQCAGTTSLWLSFAHGPAATALFSGAESWSAPLPRLEVCGTQGRSLVCEAGRRLWLHQPREAAHLLEPPGLAAHVSSANVIGLAEDLKAFLAACVEEDGGGTARDSNRDAGRGADAGRDAATESAHSLSGAARALQLVEAVNTSLAAGGPVALPSLRDALLHDGPLRDTPRPSAPAQGLRPAPSTSPPVDSLAERDPEGAATLPLPL